MKVSLNQSSIYSKEIIKRLLCWKLYLKFTQAIDTQAQKNTLKYNTKTKFYLRIF